MSLNRDQGHQDDRPTKKQKVKHPTLSIRPTFSAYKTSSAETSFTLPSVRLLEPPIDPLMIYRSPTVDYASEARLWQTLKQQQIAIKDSYNSINTSLNISLNNLIEKFTTPIALNNYDKMRQISNNSDFFLLFSINQTILYPQVCEQIGRINEVFINIEKDDNNQLEMYRERVMLMTISSASSQQELHLNDYSLHLAKTRDLMYLSALKGNLNFKMMLYTFINMHQFKLSQFYEDFLYGLYKLVPRAAYSTISIQPELKENLSQFISHLDNYKQEALIELITERQIAKEKLNLTINKVYEILSKLQAQNQYYHDFYLKHVTVESNNVNKESKQVEQNVQVVGEQRSPLSISPNILVRSPTLLTKFDLGLFSRQPSIECDQEPACTSTSTSLYIPGFTINSGISPT